MATEKFVKSKYAICVEVDFTQKIREFELYELLWICFHGKIREIKIICYLVWSWFDGKIREFELYELLWICFHGKIREIKICYLFWSWFDGKIWEFELLELLWICFHGKIRKIKICNLRWSWFHAKNSWAWIVYITCFEFDFMVN